MLGYKVLFESNHLVRVFDAEDELAAGCLGKEVVEQSRPERSQVQISGRRRRKTGTAWRAWQLPLVLNLFFLGSFQDAFALCLMWAEGGSRR